jgi:hypothetical protein
MLLKASGAMQVSVGYSISLSARVLLILDLLMTKVAPGAMDTPLLLGASQEFREKMLAAYVLQRVYYLTLFVLTTTLLQCPSRPLWGARRGSRRRSMVMLQPCHLRKRCYHHR